MPIEKLPDKIRSINMNKAIMPESAVKYIKLEESREAALIRDNRRCKFCDTKNNLHVHHLIPRHLGGSDEAANLITLCAACHAAHHPTLQVSLSRSFIERWALKLARLLDSLNEIPEDMEKVKVALRLLGKNYFREGQLEVVLAAMRNESILVVRPTGSGKSLCYQVPALMSSGTSYVFSPLKALMADQSLGLHQNMIPATFINSDLILKEKQARYELLEKKALKFLFLTPERFDPDKVKNVDEINKLTQIHPSYLVVDEAHCIDRWGNDFRPSYGRLAEVRTQLGNPSTLAFTATAGVKAQKRILASMGIPNATVFVSDVDRPNIALIRHEPESISERYRIIKMLIGNNDGKAMIFVPTIKIGKEVSRGLLDMGMTIPFYYGQMSAIDREFMLGQFTGRIAPETNNIICTNAFGMGIDIPNVHLVIHWMQPESVEDYLQELGRAGRDGKLSIALIFKSPNDTDLRLYMAKMTAQETAKKGLDAQASLSSKTENIKELDRMIMNRRRCFRKQIMEYFKEDKIKKSISIAMMIIEWVLCSKSKADRSNICCDVCNPEEVKRLLGNQSIPTNKYNKEERMAATDIKEVIKWEWKPKRWWIGLIIYGLLGVIVSKIIMDSAVPPDPKLSIVAPGLLFLAITIWAAFTDKKERSISKRILFVFLTWVAWQLCSGPCIIVFVLLSDFVGINASESFWYIVATAPFVIYAMQQSTFFVQRATNITQT
jgi:ATP-dependent DNA helicase RecQ